ncbi:hypothetical protein SK128_015753 [Halocaridina rubra]|uniref:Uncharacterized protein n=1 Tax=Halocaridina rubra TaxID=373956 RepID=A0AAN8WJ21_HALRR
MFWEKVALIFASSIPWQGVRGESCINHPPPKGLVIAKPKPEAKPFYGVHPFYSGLGYGLGGYGFGYGSGYPLGIGYGYGITSPYHHIGKRSADPKAKPHDSIIEPFYDYDLGDYGSFGSYETEDSYSIGDSYGINYFSYPYYL